MFASFARHTSAATALLFAMAGLPAVSSAAVSTPQTKSAPQAAAALPGEPHLTGRAAYLHRRAATAKHPLNTPFNRIMLPKIKEQQAQQRAERKANPAASAAPASPRQQPMTGPNGLAVNFPGFYQPPAITTAPITGAGPYPYVDESITADVNKDGKPDLVTITNGGASLNVLLNTGSGLPSTPTSSNTTASTFNPSPWWLAAADLNGDGYPDIEMTDAQSGAVYIWMNNGNGTFGTATQIILTLPVINSVANTIQLSTVTARGGDVIFADVTGDNKPDLVVLSGQQVSGTDTILSVQVWAGAGDGTFPTLSATQSTTLPSTLVDGSYHSLQAVDLNNDGKLDLVFPAHLSLTAGGGGGGGGGLLPPSLRPDTGPSASEMLYNYVLLGDGTGNFSTIPTVTSTTSGVFALDADESAYSSYVGNVAANGTPAVVVQGEYAIYTQLSNNDGTLQAPLVSPNPQAFDNLDTNFADVNGDGNLDAVLYTDNGFVSIFLGAGDGTFSSTASQSFIAGFTEEQQPTPADYNGDGIVDILTTDYYSSGALFAGLGNGKFKAAPVVAPPSEDALYIYPVLTGNLTGSGFADVLLYDNNGPQYSLLTAVNDGKGNFTYKTALSATDLNSVANWSFIEPTAVDVNGDQKPDLIIIATNGIFAALNNGDGTFAPPVQIVTTDTIGCAVNYFGVADLNSDGKADLVFPTGGCGGSTNVNAGYYTLLNNGGTFPSNFTETFTVVPVDNVYQIFFADYNNDGKLDMLLQADGVLSVMPGVGDGTFNLAAIQEVFASQGLVSFLPVDYDGDGKQDVVAYGYMGGFGFEMLKGMGDFTFQPPVPFGSGAEVYGAAVADFNGDGLPDIAMTGYFNDNPFDLGDGYMVNLGGSNFSNPVYLPSGNANEGLAATSSSTPILLGDFNGDGATDFLGVSYYTGGVFYNTGAVTMALSTSAGTAAQDSSVTLTAAVTPTLPGAQATGTVTFYDNGVAIGTATVSSNVATLTLTSLPVGTNVITAVYSGDANYNGATSTASVNGSGGSTGVGVTALPAAFTMTAASGGSLNLTVGQTGTATFTLTGNATFSGAVSIACSGVPQGTSCTILPGSTITLAAGQSTTFGVVLDTTAPNNHYNAANSVPTWMKTTGGITLAGGLLLLLPTRRRRQIWPLVLFATLGLGAAVSLSGCSHKYEGTPAGSYTVNVTATSGSITQTGSIALTIHK